MWWKQIYQSHRLKIRLCTILVIPKKHCKKNSEHERKAGIGWKFSLYQGKRIWKSYKWTQSCSNETNVNEQREQLKNLPAKTKQLEKRAKDRAKWEANVT